MATGHLRKRGNSWLITIELDKDPFGERQRIYKSIKSTKKEANALMHKMLAELETGTYVEPNKLKVGEYLLSWLKGKRPDVAERTYVSYKMIIEKHLIPYFGQMDISKLQHTPLAIDNYKNEKLETLSNRTVHYHLSILGQALKKAVQLKVIKVNPVDSIDKPRVQKAPVEFLTVEQADYLLGIAKKYREYPVIYFAYKTGMRLGEILGLQWKNVEIKTGHVKVRTQLQYIEKQGLKLKNILKTDSSYRTVAVSLPVIELLESLPKLSDYVFCIPAGRYAGKPFDPNNFDNRVKKIFKRAELDITMHSLRHTHVSQLLMAGVPVNKVQKRVGHERASTTTDIYGHVIPEKEDDTVDILEQYQNASKI